jgi:hypothetical protein
LGQLDAVSHEGLTDWQILSEPCGEQVAAENIDELTLNINGAVQNGQLRFSVQSKLSEQENIHFKKDFEITLNEIIQHTLQIAQTGGIKTRTDFAVKGLSDNGLKALQQRFNEKDSSREKTKAKKAPKNIIRI